MHLPLLMFHEAEEYVLAPWVGFSMIWFELIVNNAMHTILFQPAKPWYNPGLITNSFLLLPFGMVTLLVATEFFSPLDWALSVVLGVGIAATLGMNTRGRLAKLKTPERIPAKRRVAGPRMGKRR